MQHIFMLWSGGESKMEDGDAAEAGQVGSRRSEKPKVLPIPWLFSVIHDDNRGTTM